MKRIPYSAVRPKRVYRDVWVVFLWLHLWFYKAPLSEVRASDEDEGRLDYYALIDAVRYEVDVAGAFQIKHRILGVRSGKNGVRVRIQWQMRYEGRRLVRKGVTGLVLAHFEGWQLITQRGDPLFGAITSESLEGTESRVVGSVGRGGADEPERSLAQHQPPVASRQDPNDTHISPQLWPFPARVSW
jgi:hypothetical protein